MLKHPQMTYTILLAYRQRVKCMIPQVCIQRQCRQRVKHIDLKVYVQRQHRIYRLF